MSNDFTPLPCPFCGSHNVRVADRAYCDDDGEHDGVECLDCDAMNRLEYWNMRAEKQAELIEQLSGGEVPEHLMNI